MNLETLERTVDRLMTGVQTYVQNSFRLYEAKLTERFDALFGEKLTALHARVEARLATLHDGKDGVDGKDAPPVDAALLQMHIAEALAAEIAKLPEPRAGRDGKDAEVTSDQLLHVAHVVRENLNLEPIIAAAVAKEVASIEVVVPEPRDGVDGKSVSAEELRAIVEGEVAKVVMKMPQPRDGKDGRDGIDGRSATSEELATAVNMYVSAYFARNPPRDGKDGRDGIAFDQLEVTQLDERVVRFTFKSEAAAHSVDVRLPGIVDKGVYRDELSAEKGDAVSWDGSLWIAQRASQGERPGTSDAWRLAVKHGRPGRDLTVPKEVTRGPVLLK